MKKLFLLLFIVTITTGVAVNALAQTHEDSTPKLYMNKKGGMTDHGGTRLAYINKDNIVRNSAGAELYFIDKSGNVSSADGKKMGLAKKNGAYYNINGVSVLNTNDMDKERCAMLDPQGHSAGTIHNNYKLHACAIHCYWLEQAKLKKEKEQKIAAK